MLSMGMSLSGAWGGCGGGGGASRSVSLCWKVEGKGWRQRLEQKVTENRPGAARFHNRSHSGHTELVDTTLAFLKKQHQGLG